VTSGRGVAAAGMGEGEHSMPLLVPERVVGEGVRAILAAAGTAADRGKWVRIEAERRRVGTWWVMRQVVV
jgi:hypothetical protein